MPKSPAESSRPTPATAPPWPIFRLVGLIALLLLPVSIGTFWRVGSTEIELDLTVNRMAFRITEDAPLGPVMKLAILDLSGLAVLDPLGAAPGWQPSGETRRLTLTVAGGKDADGKDADGKDAEESRIQLGWGVLPAGSELDVEALPGPGRFRLTFRGTPIEPMVTASGMVMARLDEISLAPRVLDAQAFRVASGEEDLVAVLELQGDGSYRFQDQLRIEDPSFFFARTWRDGQRRIERRDSTVQSGRLELTEMEDREVELRVGDRLTFDRLTGLARTVELLETGAVRLRLYGSVKGLRIESISGRTRNLMPRYLSWLKAQDAVLLAWSTWVYFAGLLVSAYLTWRKAKYGEG